MPRRTGQLCKADVIREYLRNNPNADTKTCAAQTGLEFNNAHFYKLRKRVRDEITAKAKENVKTEHAATPVQRSYAELLAKLNESEKKVDEYRYRVWKLEGEKFGYVEKLLKESH